MPLLPGLILWYNSCNRNKPATSHTPVSLDAESFYEHYSLRCFCYIAIYKLMFSLRVGGGPPPTFDDVRFAFNGRPLIRRAPRPHRITRSFVLCYYRPLYSAAVIIECDHNKKTRRRACAAERERESAPDSFDLSVEMRKKESGTQSIGFRSYLSTLLLV